MDHFKDFELVIPHELFILRHNWFFPYFELTDGKFMYARLSFKSSFRRYAVIETAKDVWTIKPKGWFKRSLLVNKGEDETIGTLIPETWKRNIDMEMDNGFKGVYLYKKLFSRSFSLTHEMYGDILQIIPKAWGFKKPFVISYSKALRIDNLPPVPLLVLAGISLILTRQGHGAAAAH